MDPLLEHILTYITETCLDPKIWGLFMCTSKYFYDNLIMRFLVTKFKCMVVRTETVCCNTYRYDKLYTRFIDCYQFILTANPYLIKAHAMMEHTGVCEILGFYIRHLEKTSANIIINTKQAFSSILENTFYHRIDMGIMTQLLQYQQPKYITTAESRTISKETIDTHYWNYSERKLNDPHYIEDMAILNDNEHIVHRSRKTGFFIWDNKNQICDWDFNFHNHISICICCGMCHVKKID
jgi:hypothetical protein